MDAGLRNEAETLRAMGSEQAATYLIENCPLGSRRTGDALVLIQHLSWKAADQMRLARHYLAGQPHANPRAFEVFASFMSLKNFAEVIREVWPPKPEDERLFRYHVGGVIQKYETSDDNKRLIGALLDE